MKYSAGKPSEGYGSFWQAEMTFQKAFEYTHKAQQAVWAVLDTAAGKANNNLQPTPSSSFTAAHKAWYADFFLAMEDTLAAFLHSKIVQEVSY